MERELIQTGDCDVFISQQHVKVPRSSTGVAWSAYDLTTEEGRTHAFEQFLGHKMSKQIIKAYRGPFLERSEREMEELLRKFPHSNDSPVLRSLSWECSEEQLALIKDPALREKARETFRLLEKHGPMPAELLNRC
jgi:hypothetical protein